MAVAARGGAIGCSSSAPKPTTPATRLAPSPARALALVPTSWHHTTSTTSRRLVAARFVKFSLESWLPHLLPPQQHNAEQQPEEVCRYTSLLQRAEAITFGTSPCRLSDAERMLQLCIQVRWVSTHTQYIMWLVCAARHVPPSLTTRTPHPCASIPLSGATAAPAAARGTFTQPYAPGTRGRGAWPGARGPARGGSSGRPQRERDPRPPHAAARAGEFCLRDRHLDAASGWLSGHC